jgi:hypothetical protein
VTAVLARLHLSVAHLLFMPAAAAVQATLASQVLAGLAAAVRVVRKELLL